MTTEENRRHWAAADGLSARAANSPEVRRILRNRARYEVVNNSYARGIVLTLANDCVGTGPRLQMLTSNAEANRRIEQEFSRWAKAVGLAEKLRTMRVARAQDGEAFAILTSNSKLPTAEQLDLRLVEADQVCTPDLSVLTENANDGIAFDTAGNPVEYHVLREHPGASGVDCTQDSTRRLVPGRVQRLVRCFVLAKRKLDVHAPIIHNSRRLHPLSAPTLVQLTGFFFSVDEKLRSVCQGDGIIEAFAGVDS